jgi:RNA methyltransferase, TrmH family
MNSRQDDGVEISSPSNPRVRAAARLRDRRERTARGLTIIDGVREIGRAIDAGVAIEEVFLCRPLLSEGAGTALLERLEAAGLRPAEVSEAAFEKMAYGNRFEGIVAVARAPTTGLEAIVLGPEPLLVVTEDVEKPGNVGAILRSADGAGADAVIIAAPGTDLFNPNVIRASIGTVFSVPAAVATAEATVRWLRARAIRIVAARLDGTSSPWEVDLTQPTALVLGSEREGLSGIWSDPDVVAVRLPMLGEADSLNVSATAAVLLYEARRQRDQRSTTT